MITGLSSSIGGPLQYLQAKPRVLLFRTSSAADDTASALKKIPPALPTGTALDSAALGAGEDDLATFLLPRILRAAASLQAAHLASPAPRTDGLQNVHTRLWSERVALLTQLEELLATTVGVLAESGVRLEWQEGDGEVQGGLGKAREMTNEMIKLIRGELRIGSASQALADPDPAPHQPSFLHHMRQLLTTLALCTSSNRHDPMASTTSTLSTAHVHPSRFVARSTPAPSSSPPSASFAKSRPAPPSSPTLLLKSLISSLTAGQTTPPPPRASSAPRTAS